MDDTMKYSEMPNSSDLVYRQAAIDALDGEITVTGRANAEAVRGYARLVADRLKRLPSAQPEQMWIPCSERLPEHRLYVLVTYKYEYGLIDNGITWYSETENKWNTSREVIAWMPLPEPWRGEQE